MNDRNYGDGPEDTPNVMEFTDLNGVTKTLDGFEVSMVMEYVRLAMCCGLEATEQALGNVRWMYEREGKFEHMLRFMQANAEDCAENMKVSISGLHKTTNAILEDCKRKNSARLN